MIRAGLAVAVLVALATPGWAHSEGRVQLFVDRLSLHSVAGNDWMVSLKLVDADSGTPAPGFDVFAEADGGAVTLTDQGGGRYSAPFSAAPGKRDLAIRAETVPGGTPGVPLRKVYSLLLEPGKDVSVGGAGSGGSGAGLALPVASAASAAIVAWFLVSRRRRSAVVAVALIGVVLHGAARPAVAQSPSDVRVRVERSDKTGQTPLWIPVRATVTEGDGGRPPSVDHLVFAAARNSGGDEAGPFTLGPLEANDPSARGIHQGFVIVPYGGPWTITAVAKTAHADPGVASAVLGRGTAEMVVDAPVDAAAAAAAGGRGGPKSEPLGVAVLWVHTMVALGWGIAIALLALLALPAGRRFLSDHGGNLLDGHLDKIARGAWWLTGLVVGTGIYNMANSVAYRVPLSPDQISGLFRLPYAKPYYLSLAAKLAMYAVMIGATVPLIREARRRATVDEAETVVSLSDDPSPWENPEKTGGRVAVRSKQTVAVGDDWPRPATSDGRARLPVAIMVTGGAVIITAVTLLKYFHLLGELSRVAG
ncbi:MAG TPA: hypothetical protein VG795_11620 [Acidimicrobiia bacterium]|nr:hypothetical protein [Acidimicrobiia bacterium]